LFLGHLKTKKSKSEHPLSIFRTFTIECNDGRRRVVSNEDVEDGEIVDTEEEEEEAEDADDEEEAFVEEAFVEEDDDLSGIAVLC
jgi:hypothetical protein